MNGASKAPITLPIQKQTTHTAATFYTTADYMVHYTSGATKSKLHRSVLQSYSGYESPTYQQPFNNSRFLVPMEETLLHKLQSTESRSRYLQIPDCYKLSNGGFDVKHFLPVFYFHVLALNCTLIQRTVIASSIYSLGHQSKPCDIFMSLLSSRLPFTFFQ